MCGVVDKVLDDIDPDDFVYVCSDCLEKGKKDGMGSICETFRAIAQQPNDN
jgi:hypothetical protein